MTLLENLEAAAKVADLNAAACVGISSAGARECATFAARLRADAERLRREIELSAPSSEQWNSHVTAVLERINNGPIPERLRAEQKQAPACIRCGDLPARVCTTCYSRGVHDAIPR